MCTFATIFVDWGVRYCFGLFPQPSGNTVILPHRGSYNGAHANIV